MTYIKTGNSRPTCSASTETPGNRTCSDAWKSKRRDANLDSTSVWTHKDTNVNVNLSLIFSVFSLTDHHVFGCLVNLCVQACFHVRSSRFVTDQRCFKLRLSLLTHTLCSRKRRCRRRHFVLQLLKNTRWEKVGSTSQVFTWYLRQNRTLTLSHSIRVWISDIWRTSHLRVVLHFNKFNEAFDLDSRCRGYEPVAARLWAAVVLPPDAAAESLPPDWPTNNKQ